ncbi:copper chaperone PCu(A)C [Pseudothauera rhizosphaerae]|uniref:Copper chaperone PCu(A)C n=1 Tax=Pseudothauera rhizosphaerae TaxID=2565932 RepID=A0A4S4AMJ9_9RHOO|nr:copper chaperone PCu(A)C [Pseudothauera rhizosphaerae]THF60843.1 copper chaperone PCu(A)C [Pseudothauera rhizosphaerae]
MKRLAFASLFVFTASTAFAQVHVAEPWVRATVPQQRSTGAFLKITSQEDARLVAAQSPVAKVVEVHEMKMEGDVMKMRAVPALDLPAGKTVELKPGGYHVMLIDLHAQVKEGEVVPLTLVVEGKDGKREQIEVQAPVHPLAAPANGNQHGHGHGH